jgi:hypothetical protein
MSEVAPIIEEYVPDNQSEKVIRSRIVFDDAEDKVYHETSQVNEDAILENNANLRKDNVYSDLSFGRQVASIPIIMWEKAIRDGYDLTCKDAQIAERELFRYLRSDEGKLCMVRDTL